MRILLIDVDGEANPLRGALRLHPGAEVRIATGGDDPRTLLAAHQPAIVIVARSAAAPELTGALRAEDPLLPIVVVGSDDRAAAAVTALRAGATDYLTDGDDPTDLARRVLAHAPAPAAPAGPLASGLLPRPVPGLVGDSRPMAEVRALVHVAARTMAPVLIEGETGTGKEVVARALHQLGPRADRTFLPLNCAAVPDALAESEFFGHARGAFTGAIEARPGALRLADGGTLFLDEIEELSLPLQAKLLRAVQDQEVRPLGGGPPRRVDVRIVAASNQELAGMVEHGRFRRDLYYRLRVLTIRLPALRERRGDLRALVAHFVADFNRRHQATLPVPTGGALRPLLEHGWPGNVRELENTVESLCILAAARGATPGDLLRRDVGLPDLWLDERGRILRVLDEHRWNRQRAAAALGISRVTLWRRMERHGIRDPLGAAAATATD
jgi:DNA-binding NtrC family response regulator